MMKMEMVMELRIIGAPPKGVQGEKGTEIDERGIFHTFIHAPHVGLNNTMTIDTQGCKPPWPFTLTTHSHLVIDTMTRWSVCPPCWVK